MGTHRVWKGHLTFGLLSIPVGLAVAARDKRIDMGNFHVTCRTRVSAPKYCKSCSTLLEPTEMFRGFQQGDTIVPITDAELESIEPNSSHVMEISECVPLADLDALYLAESFYILPLEGGEKSYSLLSRALAESKRAAICQLTKSSRENIVAVRPYKNGLVAQYVWFADEVAKVPEFDDLQSVNVSANEVKLATQLVESLNSPFNPEAFEDGYRGRLTQLIASKTNKGVPAPVPVKTLAKTATIDIAGALAASLEKVKKAPASKPPARVEPAKAKGKKPKVA